MHYDLETCFSRYSRVFPGRPYTVMCFILTLLVLAAVALGGQTICLYLKLEWSAPKTGLLSYNGYPVFFRATAVGLRSSSARMYVFLLLLRLSDAPRSPFLFPGTLLIVYICHFSLTRMYVSSFCVAVFAVRGGFPSCFPTRYVGNSVAFTCFGCAIIVQVLNVLGYGVQSHSKLVRTKHSKYKWFVPQNSTGVLKGLQVSAHTLSTYQGETIEGQAGRRRQGARRDRNVLRATGGFVFVVFPRGGMGIKSRGFTAG